VIVKCANCGTEQDQKNLFCSKCGARLLSTGTLDAEILDHEVLGGSTTNKLERSAKLPALPPRSAWLNLHIIRSGQILPLEGPGEYIVGRVSEGQSVLPDVDLEPFSAYESGVSRLHARIRIEDNAMWIRDLGSSNGTRVNNEKLNPHQDYPLSNKDVVRMGRFSIQALVGQE
jgi:hypothetical protein